MKTRFAAVLPILAGLAFGANAQVVTPPPATTPTVDQGLPKPQPRTFVQAPNPTPVKAQPVQVEIPKDVDLNVLIKKDASGNVLPLAGPLYVEALKANPKLPKDFFEKNKAYFDERRQSMEFVMINNLDLMDKIEDGAFEKTGYDKAQVAKLLETAKPLMKPAAPEVMSKDLKAKNLIDDMQFRITEKLVMNYVFAKNPVPAATAPKEQRGTDSFKVLIQLYKIPFDEFVHIHRDLTATAADNMRDILPLINADQATADKVQNAMKALNRNATYDQKADAMKSLREVLTMDQRKEVMRQAASIWKAQHEK